MAMRLAKCAVVGAGLVLLSCSQTGIGLTLVSPQQTEQMARAAWHEVRTETPVSQNPEYQQRVARVADRVIAAIGQDPGSWEVVVFRGPEANAFALPGGKIGVYEGMLRLAESDDELAAVLAHEVAHNQENHAAERLSSSMATDFGLQVVGAVLSGTGVGSSGAISAALGLGAQYGVLMPYSRNQELEADRVGLNTMAVAGYDPHAALNLWQKMKSEGPRPPTFLSTHPAPEARIAQLRSLMPQAMLAYRPPEG